VRRKILPRGLLPRRPRSSLIGALFASSSSHVDGLSVMNFNTACISSHIHTSHCCGHWCGMPLRALHPPPPPVRVLAPTPRSHPWFGAPGSGKLLRCALLRIVGLLARETQPAVHTAGSSNDWLGAALLLAALAASMRDTVLRAAALSSLGAAHVLAAPAAPMRLAGSPPPGSVCPRHARYRTACRLQQLPWCSPGAGSVYRRHAPCRHPCRLQRT
jgi:hypothetical protein